MIERKPDPMDDLCARHTAGLVSNQEFADVLGLPIPEGLSSWEEVRTAMFPLLGQRVQRESEPVVLIIPLKFLYAERNYEPKEGENFLRVSPQDTHTEHCCLRCGCKYSSSDCTVVCRKLPRATLTSIRGCATTCTPTTSGGNVSSGGREMEDSRKSSPERRSQPTSQPTSLLSLA